jgi:hypothetical protein
VLPASFVHSGDVTVPPTRTKISITGRLLAGLNGTPIVQRPSVTTAFERFRVWRKRPPGLGGGLFLPVPLIAGLTLLLHLVIGMQAPLSWLSERACEMAWLVVVSTGLATLGQVLMRVRSESVWRSSMGRRHIDYSPHRWHYALSFLVAAIPLVLLQLSPVFVDVYLAGVFWLQRLIGSEHTSVIGYTPDPANLMVLLVYLLVDWQARRWILNIPPGRILGLHRELQRLGGRVGWREDVWNQTVSECVDRWLGEQNVSDASWLLVGDGLRQQRARFAALRKEVLAAWAHTPPDIPRLQRAVALYRKQRIS